MTSEYKQVIKIKKTVDYGFIIMSAVIYALGWFSTILAIIYLITGKKEEYKAYIVITTNIILLIFFSIYYFDCVINKNYEKRYLISIPFTLYSFFIFIMSAFYFIIPIIALFVSLIFFLISLDNQKYFIHSILLYIISVSLLYLIIVFLQMSHIIPIYVENVGISFSRISPRSIIFLIISGISAYYGVYLIHKKSQFQKEKEKIKAIQQNNKINKKERLQIIRKEYQLTNRQSDILEYLLDNKKVKEISEILNISDNSVKLHKKNLFQKINVNSTQELLIFFFN